MTMNVRLVIVSLIVGTLCFVTTALTDPPGMRNDLDNDAGQEWQVRYDPTETVKKMFKKAERKAEQQALRLRIQKDQKTKKYSARLWRFKAKGGGGYELADKTDNATQDWIPLAVEDQGNGRHRMGFHGEAPLYNSTGVLTGNTVSINGVWQPGIDWNNHDNDRIQMKLYVHPTLTAAQAKAKSTKSRGTFDDCEEDPDTDVLEETDPPPMDDDPPPP
jgi:hypothetical protein